MVLRPPHLNLSCLIFFSISHRTYSSHSGKEKTERAGEFPVGAKTERTGNWAPA